MRGLSSVLFLALPIVALAQPPGLTEGKATDRHFEHKIQRLNEHVSLDEAQIEQIRAVLEVTREDMRAARDDLEASVDALREARESGNERELRRALQEAEQAREAMHAARRATEDEVKAQLTLEQRATLFEMETRRKRGPEGERPRGERRERDSEARAFEKL